MESSRCVRNSNLRAGRRETILLWLSRTFITIVSAFSSQSTNCACSRDEKRQNLQESEEKINSLFYSSNLGSSTRGLEAWGSCTVSKLFLRLHSEISDVLSGICWSYPPGLGVTAPNVKITTGTNLVVPVGQFTHLWPTHFRRTQEKQSETCSHPQT